MYKIILPARYFIKRRIAILAVAAVALCVFMVVVVMTVISGVVEDFRQKNHDFFSDCIVNSQSLVGFAYYEDFATELESKDFVEAVSPVIRTVGVLTKAGADWNMPVEVVGIDPARHSRATTFGQSLYYHRDDPENAFLPKHDKDLPGVVLGIDLSRERGADGEYYHSPQPGQIEVRVSCFPLTAKGNLLKAGIGGEIVNTKGFFYSDDSHSGLVRGVDSKTIYLPIARLAALCAMGGKNARASAIHVKFTEDVSAERGSARVAKLWDDFKADRIADAKTPKIYASLLENVIVQSWKSYRRESIAPMEKEQTMMTLVFAMLGIITVFIILVVFYMIISSKSKDIGILKSIGISTSSVIGVFIAFAGLIGFIGTAIGMAGGCAFLVKINEIEGWLKDKTEWSGVWNPSVYAIDEIPNNIEWQPLAIIAVCAMMACLVGVLIPSYQAARRQVAQTLQVNQL